MYKFKEIPRHIKKVRYIKLIKPYKGNYEHRFPEKMKVGDITWIEEIEYIKNNKLIKNTGTHIENNRYCGNFDDDYFELLPDLPYEQLINIEPYYEIY